MASKLDIRRHTSNVPSKASSPAPSVVSDTPQYVVKEENLPRVTERVVDEAVHNVLADMDIPEEEKEVLRKLMANDSATEFAANLFATKTEPKGGGIFRRLQRQKLNITQVLGQDDIMVLSKYASEFDLSFLGRDNHDHPMAAAMRRVDTEIIKNMLPFGISVKDVGADPLQLINDEEINVHGCNPSFDWKDPSRGTVRTMRAKKIARDESRSAEARGLATKYLMGDESFVCSDEAQNCRYQAKITRSIHVYDVKLEDWPVIMQSAGASMHVGAVLFPATAYQKVQGVMPSVHARYEIDVEKNVFRMAFEGSASWFYSHSWLDFMRYGVDQIIETKSGRYSYKVIERRGDTLFFQILKVDQGIVPSRQCYKLPTVPMVRVEGFEFVQGRSVASAVGRAPLQPKVHWFPQSLWMDMLQQAKMDFERSAFSFEKLYNYYRVVSPRNTINGVLISGGQRVHQDQMVALITHVGMCAASDILLDQRTSRATTDKIMEQRAKASEATLVRLLSGFWKAVRSFMLAGPFFPMVWVCDRVSEYLNKSLVTALASWTVEPQLRDVEFTDLVNSSFISERVSWNVGEDDLEEVYRQHIIRHSHVDHMRALRAVPALAASLDSLVVDAVGKQIAVPESLEGSTVAVGDAVETVSTEIVAERKMAIQECMDESVLEQKKIRELCATIMRVCVDSQGRPSERLLRSRAEEYGQPDIWQVNNGVLVNSVLGLDALECKHSALYTVKVDDATNSNFRTLIDDQFEDVKGKAPIKEYRRFSDSRFTGYALSIDRLLIYNGPEIRETLQLAISSSHDYLVELRQGPPGCGKTYELVRAMGKGDVAMCPVRQSAMDTRDKLVELHGGFPEVKLRCRTVDSYLTNFSVPATKELRADVLHADEGFMTHSGKWYAAAALLRVRKIVVYGDQFQIPHIQRVQARGMFIKIAANTVVSKYETYRCPADAVAAWNHIYEHRVRTLSKIRSSLSVATDVRQVELKQGHVLLCMYQADKKEIQKLLSSQIKSKSMQVMSVHESEGKTFKDVALFRFDMRVRSDKMSLFDQQPHVLVGMSRHTHSFVYIRPKDLGDLVDVWIKKSRDPRSIAAAMDVNSVGRSVEFK